MKARTVLAVAAAVLAVSAVVVAIVVWGGGADRPAPPGPTVVATYQDVAWYPPCATYPIELGGRQFYPLPMDAPPVDESRYPPPLTLAGVAVGGFGAALPRVIAPGPGDDIGTVVEYSDGMARFESQSGNVAWLTLEVQEYGYVC